MKVLFFTSWLPTPENPSSGNFILEHARAIHFNGNEVTLLALVVIPGDKIWKLSSESSIDETGFPIHSIQIRSKYYKWIYVSLPFQYILLKKYYRKHIKKKFTPEIIHSNVIYPAGILGYWLSKYLKTKHVITEHWSQVTKFFRISLYKGVGVHAYNSAIFITPVSDFLGQKIIPYVKETEKIHTVPNVIDDNLFTFQPKTRLPKQITFTAIAIWNRFKRPDLFVKALDQIVQKGIISENVLLNIIGEGEYLEQIKKMPVKFKVNFTGFLNKEEIAKTLHGSDYFLHASEIETFSIVTAEALLTGTPAIVSNRGALPELINEENGILVENTVEDWVKGIISAIKKQYSGYEISKAVKNRFSYKQVGTTFSYLYKRYTSKPES